MLSLRLRASKLPCHRHRHDVYIRRALVPAVSLHHPVVPRRHFAAPAPPNPDNLNFKGELSKRRYSIPKDPLRIAEEVKNFVDNDKFGAAFDVVRYTGRFVNNVVAWNHLIDARMKTRHYRDAFRTFNEMKKRGIKPDTYTITILLRGLANTDRTTDILAERAMKLYTSLTAPDSSVKPDLIHTNIVLRICAAQRDAQAIWTILRSMPTAGPNAPDKISYTAIFNGIESSPDGPEDARRIWAGVLSRWEKGTLSVDATLVGAVCRVLLSSRKAQDAEEVLRIIEHMFGISPPPDLGEPGPGGAVRRPQAPAEAAQEPQQPDASTPRPHNQPYVVATQRTLEHVLQACLHLRKLELGRDYWRVLTSPPYRIRPDQTNYYALLRLFAKFRMASRAAEVLRLMIRFSSDPHVVIQANNKAFFLALSACKMSNTSRGIIEADKLLNWMKSYANYEIDGKILETYLQVALASGDPGSERAALYRVERFMRIERIDESPSNKNSYGAPTLFVRANLSRSEWRERSTWEMRLLVTMLKMWDRVRQDGGEDPAVVKQKMLWLQGMLDNYSLSQRNKAFKPPKDEEEREVWVDALLRESKELPERVLPWDSKEAVGGGFRRLHSNDLEAFDRGQKMEQDRNGREMNRREQDDGDDEDEDEDEYKDDGDEEDEDEDKDEDDDDEGYREEEEEEDWEHSRYHTNQRPEESKHGRRKGTSSGKPRKAVSRARQGVRVPKGRDENVDGPRGGWRDGTGQTRAVKIRKHPSGNHNKRQQQQQQGRGQGEEEGSVWGGWSG